MIKFAVFDIETIPGQSLPQDLIPQFDPDSVKVGNIKDQVKIDEKIETAQKEFEEGLSKKMSLDPDLCEVVCFVCQNEKVFSFPPPHDEQFITNAWWLIERAYHDHIPLVSYNGIGFDLPVLLHSAMKLDIPVSPQMYSDLTKKYDNRYHYDLMQILAGWDKTKWKSLDFYLKLFGIGEKSGDGSQVYDMWKVGEYDKVKAYCEQDVAMTAKLFERLEPWIVKELDK